MTLVLPDAVTAQRTEDAYNPLLTRFLATGLSRTVQQVQACDPLVPDDVRVRAWHQLSYALRTGELWPETRELLLALAPKMEQAGFREEWIVYLTAGVAQGQEQADAAALGELALQIAILYRMISQYETAITWLQTSLTHFRRHGDTRGQARALNEWAWVEQLRRRYAEAAKYVEDALALLPADDSERGMCYRTQGMIAHYQGEWQLAEKCHRLSLELFEQRGDLRKAAWQTLNLAIALRSQKKFEVAVEMGVKAAQVMKSLGDEQHWSVAQINLGLIYYHSGQLDKAICCLLEAEGVVKRLHDRLRLADLHLNLALAYLAQGTNENASNSFLTSIHLYQELGMQNMVVNSMDGLAMSYIARHQYDQALQVLQEAMAILPQIINVPYYDYYQQSLIKHWKEAKAGHEFSFETRTDID